MGRVLEQRLPDAVRLEIPTKRNASQLALHLLLLSGCGGAAVLALAWGGADALFVASLGYSLLIGLWALAQVAFGKEAVTASDHELVLERPIWPWHYTRRYAATRVERLRVERRFVGTIAFDYDGRTQRFGHRLEETEATRVVEMLAAELGLRPPA